MVKLPLFVFQNYGVEEKKANIFKGTSGTNFW